MELSPAVQLAQAGAFLLLGAAAGLIYDALGGLRDACRAPTFPVEALLLAAGALCLFAGGLGSMEGRPRLYMLACAAAGWGLWAWGLSPVLRPLWGRLWRR